MLSRPVMLRPCLLLTCLLSLPCVASAQVSARFSNQVATHGQDLGVQLLVEDPGSVVHSIQVELRRPLEAVWTATTARAQPLTTSGPQSWIATFPAEQVWPTDNPPPSSVEVRALLYGRRGGLLLVVGEIEPFEMDALAPSKAAARTRALTRPTATAPQGESTGADELSLAGYVGLSGRAASTGRLRVFIAAGGPLSDTLELGALVIVGPAFAEPADRDGGGPFVLGFEVDLRAYVWPLSDSTWNLFALPFVGVDMRLPGVDLLGGLRAGALYWVSTEVAVEASLGGGPVVFGVSSPAGETTALGFTGGLRLGVRFGPERK